MNEKRPNKQIHRIFHPLLRARNDDLDRWLHEDKMNKKSYGIVAGIGLGFVIGMAFGSYLAISNGLFDLAYSDDVRVRQGIVILKMLETNDVTRAKHFLNLSVACDYLRQRRRQDSWFIRQLYQDNDITQFVNERISGLPALKQEIEKQEKQPTKRSR